jgi:hypothetical protein
LGGVVIKGVKKIRVDQEALGRDPWIISFISIWQVVYKVR